MKRILTGLTDEQQALVGPIAGRCMAADRARLARVVRVHLDRHAPLQEGFIVNLMIQKEHRTPLKFRLALLLTIGCVLLITIFRF